MVKFSYYKNKKKINAELPASFSEITIEEYLNVDELIKKGQDDPKVYISLLSKVDYSDIEQFPGHVIISLTDALRFIWESDSIWVKDFKGLDFKPVGALQIMQFEDWKVKYSQIQDDVKLIPYTVSLLYSGQYNYVDRNNLIPIFKLPADIGVYCKNFYNIGFAEHQKKYAPLYQEHSPDAEEAEAGYEQLSKWGFHATLDYLADGDVLKKEQIAKVIVDDIYTHLSYQKTHAQYIKNYRKIVDNAIQRGDRTH